MAVVKLAPIYSQLSGQAGSLIASRHRLGNVIRQSSRKSNVNSNYLSTARSLHVNVMRQWGLLTQVQRQLWIDSATSYPCFNRVGNQFFRSGLQFFAAINARLRPIGLAYILTPPSPIAVAGFNSDSLSIVASTHTINLFFSPTWPANYWVLVYMSRCMPLGRLPQNSDYKLIARLSAGNTSPYNLYSAYIARFPAYFQVGFQLHVKLIHLHSLTGSLSQPQFATGIVTT